MGVSLWHFSSLRPMRAFLVASATLCAAALPAADVTKLGSGTDLLDGASWLGGAAPGASDIATWDGSSLATGLTLGTNVTWQGVRITGSSGSGTVGVTGAGVLSLGSSGINLEGSAVSATFGNALALAEAQSWRVNAGRTLTVSGALSGSSALAVGSAPAHASSLFLSGTFQTVATNANLGDITGIAGLLGGNFINSQRTSAAHGYLVSSSAGSQVYWLQALDGALKAVKVELQQSGSDIQARVLAAKYQSGGAPGFDFETGGLAGTVANANGSDGYGVFSLGLLTEASPSSQAGQVTLSGSNGSYSGNLTVNRGRLVFGSGSAFDGGNSPSAGSGTLTVGPLGVVSNSAANAIWGGHTNTRSVVLNGGVIDYSNNQEYLHALEMTSGLVTRGNGGSTQLFRVGSSVGAGRIVTNASPASARIDGAIDLTFNGLSLEVADGAAANDLVVGAAITQNTGAGSGAKSVTKEGSGTLLLSGSNAFTGGLFVNAGLVRTGIQRGLGALNTAVGAVTIASGATVDLNGVADATYGYTLSGTGTAGQGALVNNGAGIGPSTAQTTNLRLAADATIGGSGEWGMVGSGYAATSIDLAGFTLTKSGSGAFHLANTSFTAGTLSIQGGRVFLNGTVSNTATNFSLVNLSLANVSGATFDLNGKSLTVGSLAGGGSAGGAVALGTGTLTVGNASSTSYAGVISGAGGVVKQGAGMLTLTGSSTYTGGLTVNAGTLRLAAASQGWNTSIFGSLATVNNGGRLQVNGGNNTSSSSSITVNGGGVLEYIAAYDANGANTTYLGTANLAGSAGSAAVVEGVGAPRFGYNANGLVNSTGAVTNTWSAGILLVNGGGYTMTLTAGSGNTLAISGVILDHAGLENTPVVKNGAGTLSLSGVNTFTGALTVSAGTLELAGAGRLGNGTYGAAIANNAVLSVGTTANQTLSGVISGSGSLLKSNSGTLTLNGANTFTGGVTLSAGAIALGHNAGLGTGALTFAGGTLQTNGSNRVVANNLVIQASTTSSLLGAPGGDLMYIGAATGSGAVNLNSTTSRSVWLQGDWSAFTGTINVTVNTGGTNYRLGGNPGFTQGVDATNGSDFSQAKFVLAGAGTDRALVWNGQRGALVRIGELSGSGGRIDHGADGRHANWSVGHLGTSSTFSGIIQGASTALTKVGAGTLTLGGANTFQGGVTVAAGTLRIGHMNALGGFLSGRPVTQVVVASGATVDLNGVLDATYGYTLSGDGVGGLGALVNNGSAIGNGTAQTTNLRLAADAAVGGTGNWALLANSFNPTSLDLGGNTLTKVGSNTLSLVNTTATAGAIRVSAGALALVERSSNLASVALTLDNASGVAFQNSGNFAVSLGSLSGGGGAGGSLALGSGSLNVGGLGSSTTYGGVISGAGSLTKSGAGTLTLTGINTHSGSTTVAAGTLIITAGTSGSASGLGSGVMSNTVTIGSGATLRFATNDRTSGYHSANVAINGGTLTFDTLDNSLAAGSTLTLGQAPGVINGVGQWRMRDANARVAVAAAASGSVISVASLTLTTANGIHTFEVEDGAQDLDLLVSSGITSHFGSERLAKTGAGTLSLTGSNTLAGGVALSAGTLEFASGSLGGSGAVTLSGGTLRWASGNTQDLSSRLAIAGSATLNTNGNEVAFSSALSGGSSLTLTKSGAGILTLNAASTGLSSTWTIAAGTLKAGHAQAFGTGAIRVEGGVLDLSGLAVTNTFTLAGGSVTGFASLNASQLDFTSNPAPKLSGVISGELNLANKAVDATGGLTAAGTLKGDGAVFSGGTVTLASDAIHAPGSSPGTHTFASGLTYAAGSTLQWEIELEPGDWAGLQPVRGSDYDAVNVTGGDLVIGSGATLELVMLDPLNAAFNDPFWDEARAFQAISFTSSGQITGSFVLDASAANVVAAGRGQWSILQDASGVSLNWTPVPEPSTYGLMLGGVALAAACLRRRRRAGQGA